MKKYYKIIFGVLALTLLVASGSAYAVDAPKVPKGATRFADALVKANLAIDQRIAKLNAVSNKIGEMKRLSDEQKTALQNQTKDQIDKLTALKEKIAGDKDLASLQADAKEITQANRTYALVAPQIAIQASAHRVLETADAIDAVIAKLHTKVDALASGVAKDSASKMLSDTTAKLTDARTKAQASIDNVKDLVPDGGDKTKFEANKKAVTDARTSLRQASDALRMARSNLQAVMNQLKSLNKNQK